MNLKELYRKAIKIGIKNDPRSEKTVLGELKKNKNKYEELKKKEKEFFDKESLENPYSDSRILNGSGDETIKTVLVGIDIEVGELILADILRNRGKQIDAVIAHHPEGLPYAMLYDVMKMQANILSLHGVPINVAESLMEHRVKEVQRRLMPINHTRAVDAARLIGLPFMNLHTPADNMVATYLQRLFDKEEPCTMNEVVSMLLEIEEYKQAAMNGAGPNILIGSKERSAGKIFIDMTGGTEGSKDIFKMLLASDINTIVCMHLSEDHRKEAEKNHLNVIIAGHIASDNLGLNLMFDRLLLDPKINVIECSGFRRVKRK
ncbi:MAG: NGG1p interacting factor NIF3 [bacterium]|nr:NGG1p interacting factor NIF3 [bacterium]